MIQIRRSALVRYRSAQMFDLVNEIEAYPMRFAWCAGASVLACEPNAVIARLDLRFAGLTQSFTTRNTLSRPERITMQLVDGPFQRLEGVWIFTSLGETGCRIAFELDFEIASRLAGTALRLGFQRIADRMVDDFCREAVRAYG